MFDLAREWWFNKIHEGVLYEIEKEKIKDELEEDLKKLAKEKQKQEQEYERILTLSKFKEQIITCETCKCLVYKEDAVKGESTILKVFAYIGLMKRDYIEKIHTPYYCLKCAPKVSKKVKK